MSRVEVVTVKEDSESQRLHYLLEALSFDNVVNCKITSDDRWLPLSDKPAQLFRYPASFSEMEVFALQSLWTSG